MGCILAARFPTEAIKMRENLLEKLLDVSRQLAGKRSLDSFFDYAMEADLELFGAESSNFEFTQMLTLIRKAVGGENE